MSSSGGISSTMAIFFKSGDLFLFPQTALIVCHCSHITSCILICSVTPRKIHCNLYGTHSPCTKPFLPFLFKLFSRPSHLSRLRLRCSRCMSDLFLFRSPLLPYKRTCIQSAWTPQQVQSVFHLPQSLIYPLTCFDAIKQSVRSSKSGSLQNTPW